MKRKISIGIAEDHDLVRQGFVRMLRDYSDIRVVFEANNGTELLHQLKTTQPDVILLDIAMPILDGLNAIKIMKEHFSAIKIIVITAYSEETSIIEYVKLGANACLDKNCKIETLVNTIYGVYKHDYFFTPEITKLLVANGVYPSSMQNDRDLTEKEIIMLKLICSGTPYQKIADIKKLSLKTVYWYEHQLLQKTNSKDLHELRAYSEKKAKSLNN